MSQEKGFSVALLLCASVAAGGAYNRPARASGIAGSWSGASASATFYSDSQSQQGATASATAGGTFNINLTRSPYDLTTYHTTASGNAWAEAGADADHLLQVTASNSAPNPGSFGWVLSPTGASAEASWTNDAVVVTASPGSNLPDMVRLNFELTFSVPFSELPYASLRADVNGTHLSYSYDGQLGRITPDANNAVDSSTGSPYRVGGSGGLFKDTFHLDLPLDKLGVSVPFSLGLHLWPVADVERNAPNHFAGLLGNLALTGVTLPDGSSLSSVGDTFAFESGLGAPAPVPEPASLAAWGLIAGIAGAAAARRRSARR